MDNLSYVGIFLILCAMGLLYSLWASARKQKNAAQLRASGIRAEAEVIGLEFVPAAWNDGVMVSEACYSLTYRFYVDAPGEQTTPCVKTLPISRQFGDNLEVGLRVPVLYLPGDPQVSMLEAEVRGQAPTDIREYVKAFMVMLCRPPAPPEYISYIAGNRFPDK